MGTDEFADGKMVAISENKIRNAKNRYLNGQIMIVLFFSRVCELKFIFRAIGKTYLIFLFNIK